jgi:peptidoglycan/LPS O-acetylase OafA/YrhL
MLFFSNLLFIIFIILNYLNFVSNFNYLIFIEKVLLITLTLFELIIIVMNLQNKLNKFYLISNFIALTASISFTIYLYNENIIILYIMQTFLFILLIFNYYKLNRVL